MKPVFFMIVLVLINHSLQTQRNYQIRERLFSWFVRYKFDNTTPIFLNFHCC